MKPRSDLVLQIASTSEVAKTQAATYTGTVTELDRLSATTVAFGVEIPNRAELAFLPGQYVNIAVPGTDETRSYSFSNAPDDETLTFLVKLTPGGVMSGYLTSAPRSATSHVHRPARQSSSCARPTRPVLLLAGGTGLAPILSILRKMRADGSQPHGAPHLRRQHRRGPGGAGRDRARSPRAGRLHLGLLRRGPGHARRTRAT